MTSALGIGMGLFPILKSPAILNREWSQKEIAAAITRWTENNSDVVGQPRELMSEFRFWHLPNVQANACGGYICPGPHTADLVGVLPVLEFTNGVIDMLVIRHKSEGKPWTVSFWWNQDMEPDEVPAARRESATEWDANSVLAGFGRMTWDLFR